MKYIIKYHGVKGDLDKYDEANKLIRFFIKITN